jgi:hypothetical protein
VALNDGTTVDVSSSTGAPPSFVGFVTDGAAFTTLTVSNSAGSGYATMAHFYVASLAPTLAISLVDSKSAQLSWPAASTGYVLQATAVLPAISWTNVAQAPQAISNRFQVVVPATEPVRFFRLMQQ